MNNTESNDLGQPDRLSFNFNQSGDGDNTLISYLYRDASNYKIAETYVLHGRLSEEQAILISEKMDKFCDGFIPDLVGMDDLQKRLGDWSEDDHPWHEITSIEYVSSDTHPSHIGVDDFVNTWRSVSEDWNSEEYEDELKGGRAYRWK